jgi:hypothetical protein
MFTRCIRVYHHDGFDNCCNHDEHRPVRGVVQNSRPSVSWFGGASSASQGPVGPPSWTTAGGRDKKINQE